MKLPRLAKLVLACISLGFWVGPAQAQLYVTNRDQGTVSEYDADTGALINDSFIAGLEKPGDIVYSDGFLYVLNEGRRKIGKYDGKTGEVVNESIVTGLDDPTALAVSGNNIYVTCLTGAGADARMGKYSAETGAEIHYELIAHLQSPQGIAVQDNQLFITSEADSGLIGKYDADMGTVLNSSFIRTRGSPGAIVQLGNYLWVIQGGVVTKHDCSTGANVMGMLFPLVSNLNMPNALAVSGNNLFIGLAGDETIGKYNASTGEAINASFITGLKSLRSIAVVPAPVSDDISFQDSWALFFDKRRWLMFFCTFSDQQLTAYLAGFLLVVIAVVSGTIFMLQRKQKALHGKTFPGGLRKAPISSFSVAPTSGCIIVADSVASQIAGLQLGDVIVSLEGYRVENEEQYAHIETLMKDHNMSMIVWRNDRYTEIWAWVRDRKLDIGLQDYQPPAPQENA